MSWAFGSPSTAAESTYGYQSGTGRFEKLWLNGGTGAWHPSPTNTRW
ncbi:MAG: hypothetical protein R3F11_07250 [Verrucomicrobiales bacterium]